MRLIPVPEYMRIDEMEMRPELEPVDTNAEV